MTSLLTLPIHVVYLILDNLPPRDLLMSVYNVSSRLNAIIEAYHPYQVKMKPLFRYRDILPSMDSLQKQNIILNFGFLSLTYD